MSRWLVRAVLAQGFQFASLLTDARLFISALSVQLAEVRGTGSELTKGY